MQLFACGSLAYPCIFVGLLALPLCGAGKANTANQPPKKHYNKGTTTTKPKPNTNREKPKPKRKPENLNPEVTQNHQPPQAKTPNHRPR
jgi:hypothetical protein